MTTDADESAFRTSIVRRLAAAGCIAADAEADELIHACAGDVERLEELIARRTNGEPLAWLTGSVTFCDLELAMAPGVYVPRWQTEPLARAAAGLLPPDGVAVDLCTGTGAIAAVLGAAQPTARVVATELDPAAARCARSNGVEVLEGYLEDPLPAELEHRVDVMTGVVPYVPTNDIALLPRDVQNFEPRVALDGGEHGIDFLTEVIERSPIWLRTNGWLLLELGGNQAHELSPLLAGSGFVDVDELFDEEGDIRAICARFSPSN